MGEPLISVIVPLYNSEKFIDRCILSITRQTYKNIEIILEDGNSDDGTQEICLDWQNEDSRVRYYRVNEDEGVSVSRNQGIEQSKGEYITFVDSDDFIAEDMIQRLYGILKEHPEAQSSCCGFSVTEQEGVPQWMQGDEKHGRLRNDNRSQSDSNLDGESNDIHIIDSDDYLHHDILEGNSRCWSRMFRREAVGNIRFPEDITIGEDMLFVAEFVKNTDKIAVSDEKLYFYYQNSGGAMKKGYTHDSFDQITCWERAADIIGDSPKLRSIVLISIMLTVGRISRLPRGEWSEYNEDVEDCKKKLREYRTDDTLIFLDRDYRIKVKLFYRMPLLYMNLYHYLHG